MKQTELMGCINLEANETWWIDGAVVDVGAPRHATSIFTDQYQAMNQGMRWPLFGVLAAVGITTVMDAIGLSAFSALPLLPLFLVFWYCQRLTRTSVGFVWGRWRHYALAILYPVIVIGALAGVAFGAGVVDVANTRWEKAWLNCALLTFATFLTAIVTEEGFFRGWLWGSLRHAGATP